MVERATGEKRLREKDGEGKMSVLVILEERVFNQVFCIIFLLV